MKNPSRSRLKRIHRTNINNSDNHKHTGPGFQTLTQEHHYPDDALLVCLRRVHLVHKELLNFPTALGPITTQAYNLQVTAFSVSYSMSQIRQSPHWNIERR